MSNNEETDKRFEVEEIIAAEYEYIAQTAFQAHEDRSRVTSFYIVSLGSLFGAFFSTSLGEAETMDLSLAYLGFSGLFLFLSYFGYITLMQLVYLRKAWFESARAMNQLKDFLITKDESLNDAFRWQSKTLPKLFKRKSVAFLLAKQVAYLGAITAGAAIFYLGKALQHFYTLSSAVPVFSAILIGYLFLRYQLARYRQELEA